MKVCILSDSHDHIPLLEAAIAASAELGAEAVLHCGDLVAPSTLEGSARFGLPIHVIHGNNAGDLFALSRFAHKSDNPIRYHGMDARLDLGGRRVFLVHYPHYARAMATTGDWDLVCCGHSHAPRVDQINNIADSTTTLVNPGTVGGVGGDPATWMLGDLEAMTFDVHQLDKSIEFDRTA